MLGNAKVQLLRQEKKNLLDLDDINDTVQSDEVCEVKKDDVMFGAGCTMEPVGTPIFKLQNNLHDSFLMRCKSCREFMRSESRVSVA